MKLLTERFWAKVDSSSGPDGCWLWSGTRNRGGYGRSGHKMAHRVAYELVRGPIPDGLVLDHLCRNPPCVNPAHLEAVTDRVNILRGVGAAARHARVTACPKGHEYTAENTRWTSKNARVCRKCNAARVRAWKKAHPEKAGEWDRRANRRCRAKRRERMLACSGS